VPFFTSTAGASERWRPVARPCDNAAMRIILILGAILLSACTQPTQFVGEPRVPGGRGGCEQICQSHGMVLAGMVSMGEGYTDGCICMVPGQPSELSLAVSAAAPAAAGVVLQMRAAEEQRRRQQNNMTPP
jgi:hypothetical protein